MGWYNFGPYVTVAQKKARAEKLLKKLQKDRPDLRPVCPPGRSVSQSFWGKAWCRHLETYADHENRVGRGRSYVRNRAVCHLEASSGRLKALVAGSHGDPYEVTVTVRPLPARQWQSLKSASAGRIGSMLDLLTGKFPKEIMAQVSDPEHGLFPKLGELKFSCSCPDWAQMCKHVAATLYAFGHRLDQEPELLFLLRGTDPAELISLETLAESAAAGTGTALADGVLADIFGIELDWGEPKKPAPKRGRPAKAAPGPKAAAKPRVRTAPAAKAAPPPKAPAPAFKNPLRPKGREIAALRRRLKMTQAQFAAALGCSPATVTRWENLKVPELRSNSKDRLSALALEAAS